MGQLAKLLPARRQLRVLAVKWLPPLLLSVALLFGFHARVKADPAPSTTELATYLETHELDVGIQPGSGYDQIYYIYNNQRIEMTSQGYNHLEPTSSGPYVTWQGVINGAGQIFLYNVLTDSLLQLTSNSSNEAPFVYSGAVTWQIWDGDNWQIAYFNGTQILQITSDQYPSVRPSTNGSEIIYAEQIAPNDWKAQDYNIARGTTSTLSEGDQASTAYPQFASNGSITTNFVAQ